MAGLAEKDGTEEAGWAECRDSGIAEWKETRLRWLAKLRNLSNLQRLATTTPEEASWTRLRKLVRRSSKRLVATTTEEASWARMGELVRLRRLAGLSKLSWLRRLAAVRLARLRRLAWPRTLAGGEPG